MISWIYVVAFFSLAIPVWGLNWEEEVDGDLSSDPNAPTSLSFATGNNLVTGSVEAPGDVYDYLTFTIGPGQTLTNLLQMDFVDISSGFPGNTAFHAIIGGATSYVPDFDTIDFFLGANHMDPLPAGTDVLPDLANATLGGSGFTTPLGPGTYTYHVQQVDNLLTGYTLQFVIAGESEPTADFDNDNDIDGKDFLRWQRGESPGQGSPEELETWQLLYGTNPLVAVSAIPEPSGGLLLVGMAYFLIQSRRIPVHRVCKFN